METLTPSSSVPAAAETQPAVVSSPEFNVPLTHAELVEIKPAPVQAETEASPVVAAAETPVLSTAPEVAPAPERTAEHDLHDIINSAGAVTLVRHYAERDLGLAS